MVDVEGGWGFSVKSSYKFLGEMFLVGDELSMVEEWVFKYLGKRHMSSKVVVFSWMLLFDHILTRNNLAIRKVLPSQGPLDCVLCNNGVEPPHFFFHCEVVSIVWRKFLI